MPITKSGVIYTIFFGVLAAIVVICMCVFFQTVDTHNPEGLEFRPLPPEGYAERTLIWYKGTDYENYKTWTEALTSFLAAYKRSLMPGRGQNLYNCKYTSPPPPGQVCDVNIKDFEVCTQENNYSYHKSSPCVFLKLNTIYGWIPEYYNQTSSLPDKMPTSLKQYIEKQDPIELNTVWVSCEGENAADVENIGPIEYYPRRGFPGYYYPYENVEDYLSPLVAVHFARPVRGIIINIECKAWAKNLIRDSKEKLGSVHFELLID